MRLTLGYGLATWRAQPSFRLAPGRALEPSSLAGSIAGFGGAGDSTQSGASAVYCVASLIDLPSLNTPSKRLPLAEISTPWPCRLLLRHSPS